MKQKWALHVTIDTTKRFAIMQICHVIRLTRLIFYLVRAAFFQKATILLSNIRCFMNDISNVMSACDWLTFSVSKIQRNVA